MFLEAVGGALFIILLVVCIFLVGSLIADFIIAIEKWLEESDEDTNGKTQ